MQEVKNVKNSAEEKISTKRALGILGLMAVVLIGLGLTAGYLFFWNQPEYQTTEEYELQGAVNAVQKYPKDPQLRIELGWLLLKEKQYDRAILEYKNALKLDPKHVGAKLNIAIAYAEQKKYKEAKTELEKIKKDNPTNVDARVALGSVYYYTKEYEKALKEYEFALNANPGTVDYIMLIAKVKEDKGDKQGAIAEYKKVLAYVPSYTAAQDALKALGYKVTTNAANGTGGKK